MSSASSLSPSAVFLEHEGWLRTVVSSRLGETDAVDDVMQNIAMAVVRQKAGLAGVQRVGAWLYRIAVRQVLMYRRATGRRRKLLQRVQSDAASAVQLTEPLSVMLHDEAQSRVRQALAELGEVERQLLLLKYAEGWSYRQIAERLGVQEDTVEYRLLKARRNLRRQLSALNVED
ncbi:MAG TPA: RNA polymerase subunit sigma-24 [Planctomycetaceae bacterium]|mgnify:CR=1 FL=1|nr:RNA polymerase subunit sigma-24 [Planctomycetaceae bacterium]